MTDSPTRPAARALACATALLAASLAMPAHAATLTVGPGKQYPTVSAAIAAAHSGDAVAVSAGTYYDDFPTVNVPLTIYGSGGMAHLHARRSPPNGKGILVANASLSLTHVE